VDAAGIILRETGFEATDTFVHRHPRGSSKGGRGVFDRGVVAGFAMSDIDRAECERLWCA
jgi:hypothetical protein